MTHDTTPPIRILLDDLIRIFQINDPSLFKQPTTDKDMRKHISNTIFVLKEFQSKIPKKFKGTDLEDETLYYCASEQHAFISFRIFPRPLSDGESSKFVTMTIMQVDDQGDTSPEDTRYMAQPIFTLTGEIVDDSSIILKEAIARLPNEDGKYNLAYVSSEDEFKAAMIYADACFTEILKNKKIDLNKMAAFLSGTAVAASSQKFETLKQKTKFDTYRIMDNLPPDDFFYYATHAEFQNIFQLENSYIYNESPPEDYEEIHENILQLLTVAGSQYISHFQEGVTFTDAPIFMQNENGDSLWSISYCLEDGFGINRDYHLLIVCGANKSAQTNSQTPAVQPLAIIMGNTDYSRGEYEPLEAICKAKDNNDENPYDFYLPTEKPEEFLSAICYAEEAMETLLLQQELDPTLLSKWVNGKNGNQVADRYYHLCKRSAYALTAELTEQTAKESVVERASDAEQFIIPEGYTLN